MDPDNTAGQSNYVAQPPAFSGQPKLATKHSSLNLSAGEQVLMNIKRHPIGLLSPLLGLGFAVLILLVIIIGYGMERNRLANSLNNYHSLPAFWVVALPGILIILLLVAAAWIAAKIYKGNQIYLTNESLIQHIQTGLFSTKVEQMNLVKIEDVIVAQNGILPKLLNYGVLEINTMDSSDRHRITYVPNPQAAANAIHNAAEQAIHQNPAANHPSTGPATA